MVIDSYSALFYKVKFFLKQHKNAIPERRYFQSNFANMAEFFFVHQYPKRWAWTQMIERILC